MCADCHTPRNEQGELDRSRWLQGARMGSRPIRPNPNWADEAPFRASRGHLQGGATQAMSMAIFEERQSADAAALPKPEGRVGLARDPS